MKFLKREGPKVKGNWGAVNQEVFDKLKRKMCTPGVAIFTPQEWCPYVLHTDFSKQKQGVAAVLTQI
eukprot:1638293-Pyramimonas_sp.AAC.2